MWTLRGVQEIEDAKEESYDMYPPPHMTCILLPFEEEKEESRRQRCRHLALSGVEEERVLKEQAGADALYHQLINVSG